MEKGALYGFLAVVVVASLLLGGYSYAKQTPPPARTIDPLVGTDWLASNSGLQGLVILDIRDAKDYGAGHIPNSISVPFTDPFSSEWVVSNPAGLWLQLPDRSALFKTIGDRGITSASPVVVVTATGNPPYSLANATRVADTLIYAGVRNVAILDGGYPKWAAEGKPVTTDAPAVNPVTYAGTVNDKMFVTIDYVKERIGKALIVDARDADVYFGARIEPFANKVGHIPKAKSLPTPSMWNYKVANGIYDGTYKDKKELGLIASNIIGKSKTKEIIVYCGVGGYASSWWFVLTQVLGYENVKIYDGSAQEWVLHNDMVPYKWQ